MLTDAELREWLETLAPSNQERRRMIIDLLRHKGEDHMSADDVADCGKALRILEAEHVPERSGPRHIEIDPALLEVEQ